MPESTSSNSAPAASSGASSTNTATTNTVTLKAQPSTSTTPPVAAAAVNASDMGKALNSALKKGTTDKTESALSAEQSERLAASNKAAQDALQMAQERFKPGGHKDFSSFAAALMESFKDSLLLAVYYHESDLHAGRRGILKTLYDWVKPGKKATIDDIASAVQVNDKGEITVSRTVSLPGGAKDKDGQPMLEEVEMSKEFQQHAQELLVGFLQNEQPPLVVNESKDASGETVVYTVHDSSANKQLSKADIERVLGADKDLYKAGLSSAQAAPSSSPPSP